MINVIKSCQPAELFKLDVSSCVKPVSKLEIVGQYKFEPNVPEEVFYYLLGILKENKSLEVTQRAAPVQHPVFSIRKRFQEAVYQKTDSIVKLNVSNTDATNGASCSTMDRTARGDGLQEKTSRKRLQKDTQEALLLRERGRGSQAAVRLDGIHGGNGEGP